MLSATLIAAAPASAPAAQEVPILFNDHHVNATPNELKKGRVLAALVKGDTVLVPLRSMFEQTGATVTYNASSKTATVSKPGAEVSVTVGVPEVTINGEKRPLDVPPEIYKGTIVVPIRVLAEGMGAYVQWVPDRQIVVVRYLPPTPPPTPEPTQEPTVAPTIAPTPTPPPPPKKTNELFIAGDYQIAGKTYNEFSAGNRNTGSWAARGAGEFGPFMLGVDYAQYRYNHSCNSAAPPAPTTDNSCLVTTVGNTGQTFVPSFTGRDTFTEIHAGYKIFEPRVYVGIGWEFNSYNNGYPDMTGFGFGAEKLPDLNDVVSWYGSYYFYPNTRGTYNGFNQSLSMQYSMQTYKIGGTWTFTKGGPLWLDLGYQGNRGNAKANSPSGYTHNGLYAGFGFTFNTP
ncbi:MAG TPA: copper amine oxidase N-terminal domain-containing protein [Candidatus Aquilonibacter sp.]|nr:copper amine oxidase N-terminal domain-containing protein [Candidatus Aquilonibacter sp.]